MTGSTRSRNRTLVWTLVVVLSILHYDFWFWSDQTIALGFMPVGLLYQAFISVAAAVCWLLVVKFAWPTHIEAWAGESLDEEDRQQ